MLDEVRRYSDFLRALRFREDVLDTDAPLLDTAERSILKTE